MYRRCLDPGADRGAGLRHRGGRGGGGGDGGGGGGRAGWGLRTDGEDYGKERNGKVR